MQDTQRPPSLFKRLTGKTGIIAISVFLNFAGFTIILPILPFSVARYVAPDQVAPWVSIIIASYALCSFAAAPVLGAMSDRYGRRPVLLLSLIGSAVGFVVFGIGGALWVLLLGRIIDGITAGSISAMYAYVADTHAPADRGPAYGMLGAAGGLGFMVGPAIGGLLGQVSLSAPLYAAAALSLLNALWVLLAVPESHPAEKRSARMAWRQFNAIAQLLDVLRVAPLRRLFAVAFCFFGAATLLQANMSVLLKDLLAFSPAQVGLMLFGVGVMDIVSQGVAAPRLVTRFGERPVALAGLAINAAGFGLAALLPFHPTVPLLIAGMVVYTFGDGLFQPSANAMIADAAPQGRQGQVQGASQAQQSIARMTGPLASAWLYGLAPSGPYVVGAVVLLLGMGLLVRGGGRGD